MVHGTQSICVFCFSGVLPAPVFGFQWQQIQQLIASHCQMLSLRPTAQHCIFRKDKIEMLSKHEIGWGAVSKVTAGQATL